MISLDVSYTISLNDLYVENVSICSKQKENDFPIHHFVSGLKLTNNPKKAMKISSLYDVQTINNSIGGVVTKHERKTTIVENSEVINLDE